MQKYLLSSSSDRSENPIDDKNGRKYNIKVIKQFLTTERYFLQFLRIATSSDEFNGRYFDTIYMEAVSPLEIQGKCYGFYTNPFRNAISLILEINFSSPSC